MMAKFYCVLHSLLSFEIVPYFQNATSGRLPPRRRSNQQPADNAASSSEHTPAKPGAQLSSTSGSHKTSKSGQAAEALLSAANSTSSLSSLDATPHSHSSHGAEGTQDDLLQQDQRQHRVAARRGHGHGHATSKIKATGPILAQSHTLDAFGAAPQPAAAVHTHAVFTSNTPTSLPHDIPHAHSAKSDAPVSSATSHKDPQAEPTFSPRTPGESRHKKTAAPPQQETQGHSPSPAKREEEQPVSRDISPVNTMPSGWIEVRTSPSEVYYFASFYSCLCCNRSRRRTAECTTTTA